MPASRLLTGPVPTSALQTGAPPRPDWVAISRLMAGGGTAGRILSGDDPALGFVAPAPVLLVEPFEPLMVADPETGRTCDLQVELLVRRGFGWFPLGAAPPRPLAGWRLRAAPDTAELLDDTGNVWARPEIEPTPACLSTVDGVRSVLVLYGAWLGVRAPRGVRSMHYGPAQRAAELRDARTRGLVAAGLVAVAAR
jgi:hypothetical protein